MDKKYRKKPVIIEAIQWNGENLSEIDEFTIKGIKIIAASKKDAIKNIS